MNEDSRLRMNAYKKKVQQTQAYATKGRHKEDSDKTAIPTVQAISARQVAEQESDCESKSDHDQLDLDLLLNTKNNNE